MSIAMNLQSKPEQNTIFSFEDLRIPSSTRVYSKGDFIFMPEQSQNKIFFVKSGRVKIGAYSEGGKEILKSVRYPGEVFGELALLNIEDNNDYAQAMEKTEISSVPLRILQREIILNPDLGRKLTQLLAHKLVDTQKRLQAQIFKNTRTRIVEFLRALAINKGEKIGYSLLVNQFFTHQEIANFTGTTRQTVTSVLNELKNKNLIHLYRKKLLVKDIDLLM